MLHEPEGQLPDPRGWLDALPRRGAEALRGIRHLEALKRHVYKAKSIGEHGFFNDFQLKIKQNRMFFKDFKGKTQRPC